MGSFQVPEGVPCHVGLRRWVTWMIQEDINFPRRSLRQEGAISAQVDTVCHKKWSLKEIFVF